MILLHAGIADRRMWREHLAPLAAAGMRVIAPDLPGYGEAPPPAAEFAPWMDVIATMDAAGVEAAALVGNSFGGAVAQRIAVLEPRRVSALALISSPASGIEPSEQLTRAWEAEEGAMEDEDLDGAVRAVLEAWLLPDAPAELREFVGAMQRRALEMQAGAPEPMDGPDPLAEDLDALAVYTGPALIATGEHDMRDFELAADALALALPAARRELIAGAGHLAPLEQPARTSELLLELLF